MSASGMTNKKPSSLLSSEIDMYDEQHFTLTTLDETDGDFQKISTDFKNSNLKVKQVELLRNNHLVKRYSTEINLVLDQRKKTDPDFLLNERYLYHGSTVKKSYICDEGLDSRMAKEGCFGKGIYFSDYPGKCAKYALRGNGDEHYILLVRVMLGEAKVYAKGDKARALKREPEKEEPYTGHRFYDSVEGRPRNHREFVVYESRRALVEGIITFSVDEKPKGKTNDLPYKMKTLDIADPDDDSETDSESEADVKGNLSDTSSDSDDDDEKYKEIGADGYSSDSSHSSYGSAVGVDVSGHSETSDAVKQLLVQKRRQFEDATGVTDGFEIDRYLLRCNLNIQAAVQLYEERRRSEKRDSVEEEEKSPAEVEHPLPNSAAWNKLSQEDQEAFIQGQIKDFLAVTGLEQGEEEFARKCLASVNMNLDHAVLAYYEDMEDY